MIDRIKSIKGAHLNNGVHLSTVSGVASTKPELVRYFDKKQEAIDIITTKSFQVNPNPGNREPVICEMAPGSFGNSVGLRNPGLEKSLPPLEKLRNEIEFKISKEAYSKLIGREDINKISKNRYITLNAT